MLCLLFLFIENIKNDTSIDCVSSAQPLVVARKQLFCLFFLVCRLQRKQFQDLMGFKFIAFFIIIYLSMSLLQRRLWGWLKRMEPFISDRNVLLDVVFDSLFVGLFIVAFFSTELQDKRFQSSREYF